MPRTQPLTRSIHIRISDSLAKKMEKYGAKKEMKDSDIVREALKIFLHNVSTK